MSRLAGFLFDDAIAFCALALRRNLHLAAVVKRPHHRDARQHRRAVEIDHQQQRFRRRLPVLAALLEGRKLLDEFPGVVKRDQRAAVV